MVFLMNKSNDKIKVGREKAEDIRSAAMHREIDAFDLMEQTTQVVRDIVKDEFLRNAPQTGMAVFVHGSPSRNEMSTYSDIDILFVETVPSIIAGNKKQFNVVAKQAKWDWEVYASIACSNLASPEILESIRSYCQPVPEQGYILRIIGRNSNASKETITKIADDASLGIYSIVAKKRLDEGLDAAIKRCS